MESTDPDDPKEPRETDLRELVASFLAIAEQSPITIRDLVRLGESMFSYAGVACSTSLGSRHREAIYLTFHALGLQDFDPEHLDAKVTLPEIHRVLEMFDERTTKRIPSAYMTNEALFKGYRFYVNESVLIPRSVIGSFLQELLEETTWDSERVLDLGTGCGALGILIALMRPEAKVDLADVSQDAIKVARKNVGRFYLSHRVKTMTSDLFGNVQGPYSLIVFNAPYVTQRQYEESVEEVTKEPRLAIVGGEEGLDLILPTIRDASGYLTPNGSLVMEVGPAVEAILKKRYPQIPFHWMHKPGRPWSGVFRLNAGYPPIED